MRIDNATGLQAQLSGSFTGSFTGSLQGTASYANVAAFAESASAGIWGSLTGDIEDQTDLSSSLALKLNTADCPVEKGTGTNSAVQKNSYSDSTGNNSVAVNGVSSFIYHEGEYDERTIAASNKTIASGLASSAEGEATKALNYDAHAEGELSTATGEASHAEGLGTVTNNTGEHAEGKYNKSNKASTTFGDEGNTQHSVGIGTSTTARKNAFEIMQNGDIYIYGKGGYDGTNAGQTGVKTLQQLLTDASV